MITKKILVDWVMKHNCVIEPLPEINNAPLAAIRFRNPRTGRRAYINPPIDDTDTTFEIVSRVCVSLGIPIHPDA